jgi:glycosyltransferase involved in cell wall biosynthesis
VKPAVSVMMVCCNAAPKLPWAFGSLLAQTPNDWECIFVDDGSTDCSLNIAVSLGGPRSGRRSGVWPWIRTRSSCECGR